MFDGISPVKLSSPVLCLARSFLYYVFTFSTSDWSLQIVFLLDLVLESCMFLEICPFLLGCPICSYYSLMIFICLWYQLLFPFFNLLFCLSKASFSFSWWTWLMSHILFIFSPYNIHFLNFSILQSIPVICNSSSSFTPTYISDIITWKYILLEKP